MLLLFVLEHCQIPVFPPSYPSLRFYSTALLHPGNKNAAVKAACTSPLSLPPSKMFSIKAKDYFLTLLTDNVPRGKKLRSLRSERRGGYGRRQKNQG